MGVITGTLGGPPVASFSFISLFVALKELEVDPTPRRDWSALGAHARAPS